MRPTEPGKTVKLTIDSALQNEVEQVLAGVGAQYSPRGATAIVMNPNTGAILALANWPRVNANDLAGAPPYATDDRAVSFNYEPGLDVQGDHGRRRAAGRRREPRTPTSTFRPVLQVADRQIHDAEDHGYETLNVASILKVSSNIGADEIGMKLGAQRFDYWVHRFGFGSSRPASTCPGEEQGIVLHYWQYSGSSMGNLPFGQGESVTPIQMATAYSAIANGGILRPPHIVAVDRRASRRPLPAGHRIISPTTAAELRNMLSGVFADGGTASGAAIPGYDMAGKTGTANDRRRRPLLRHRVRRVVHRYGPRQPPQAAGRRDGRSTPGADLRWLGGGAGVPEDRRLGGAVLRDQPPLSARKASGSASRAAIGWRFVSPAQPSCRLSAASRSSHCPPTSAIHDTASDSGAGVTR